MAYLLIFVVSSLLLSFMHPGTSISISSSGTDSQECCTSRNISCGSLSFALSCISNRTTPSPVTLIIEKRALIDKKINFLIPSNYNVSVSGNLPNKDAMLHCGDRNSILTIKASGKKKSFITFSGISFQKCGPLVPAAVLVDGTNGMLSAEFEKCTFANNSCSGLNAKDVDLTIKNSVFMFNFANQTNSFGVDFEFGKTSLGGSLGVMFQGNSHQVQVSSSMFKMSETFVNKDINVVSHDTDKVRLLSNYYASGGGMSVIHAFDSSNNKVEIKDCNFHENKGTYGGGLFLTFIHNSTENKLSLTGSTVFNNYVSQTGGGILVSSWDQAHNNSINIVSCNISANTAMGGGAMKIIYNSKDPNDVDRGGIVAFEMHNSTIFENTATSGSALRLLSNLPLGRSSPILPKFHSCSFIGHRPTSNSKEYPGAILSTKLGLEFYESNTLSYNSQGSAIYISSGTIHVKGTLIFYKNRGMQGGAAYLADLSKIVLYPGSHLQLIENHADFRGGGLYVEATTLRETTYPYNPGCFLQYSEAKVPPSKWKAKVEFYNNSASMKGAALFLNSVVGCLWDEYSSNSGFNRTLRWANKIVYSGNFLLSNRQKQKIVGPHIDIATDTYDFVVKLKENALKIAPGETFTLNITAVDQLKNDVYSVPSITQILQPDINSSDSEQILDQQYFVVPLGAQSKPSVTLKMPSEELYVTTSGINDTEFLRLSATQSNFLVEKDLRLETQKCHPGFVFDGQTCTCGDLSIPGIQRCSEGRYVYLKEGYWGGIINGQFVTYTCPRGYCKCIKDPKDQKRPGCLYDYKKPNSFCIEGREDILCGRCKAGLALGLRPTECRDCNGTGWILFISIFGVLIFTLLIIYFNPNIPSDLRGILFYVQVLPYLFKPNDQVGDIVSLVSGISDLGRPTEYPLSTCAVPNLGNLGTTTLNYITPAEILLIILVIFLMQRRITLLRERPFQSFLTLMILMYKYLVETSFALIHCVNVGGKRVFFYDGSWECFQGFHLGFLIVSVLVWFFLLFLPIPLLFYFVHKGANRYPAVIDQITEGLRRRHVDGRCQKCGARGANRFSAEVKAQEAELEACSPCSEQIEEKCDACAKRSNQFWMNYIGEERGWWWAIDLARRQLLVVLYVFIQDWEIKQTVISIACLFIFALHCMAWPYNKKNRMANRIEAVYLLALVLLANVQSIKDELSRSAVSIVILGLTYTFGLFYFIKKAVDFLRKWCKKRGQANTPANAAVPEQRDNHAL